MLPAVLKIHYFLIQHYCPLNAAFQTHFAPFSLRKAILKRKIKKKEPGIIGSYAYGFSV